MKKIFLAAIALSAGLASAQMTTKTVTITSLLDVNTSTTEMAHGGTYVPGADKFLSVHPSFIRLYNGITGAFENNLSIAGISPSGNGFHAATATEGGHIYAVEDGAKDIWRWDSVSDMNPDKVYDTAEKYWMGHTATINNEIVVGFTSPDINGPVSFFSDSAPFTASSFSFSESADIKGKMALAFNRNVTMAWTLGDTAQTYPLLKFIKVNGVWQQDTVWVPPNNTAVTTVFDGAGPMAYDEENDLLFVLGMQPYMKKLSVYNGTTGELVQTAPLVNPPITPNRGGGAWLESNGNSGTFWAAARAPGTTASDQTGINLHKWSYTVSVDSGIADWVLFSE